MKLTRKIYSDWLIFLLLALTTVGVYCQSLEIPFVYDDHAYIVDNGFIKNIANLKSLVDRDEYFSGTGKPRYRPVSALLYFGGYWAWGLNPLGYHIAKILLHLLNGWLIFLFFKILLKDTVKPFCITLLFLLAPFQTEAVNCISFNDDMLACLFLLMALIASAKYLMRSKNGYYWITLVSYSLGLLSKETALIFIPLLLLKGYCFPVKKSELDSKISTGRSLGVGVILVTALYLIIRFIIFTGSEQLTIDHPWIMDRIILIARVLLRYIGILILPLKLTIDYSLPLNLLPFQMFYWLVLGIVTCLLIISIRFSLVSKKILWGVGWFFLSLLPVIHLIAGPRILAEHYLYIASIGWFWIWIFIIEFLAGRIAEYLKIDLSRKRKSYLIMILFVLPLSISFALLSWNRNRDWLTEKKLWEEALLISPQSITALNNLGKSYGEEGDYDRARKEYDKVLALEPSSEKAATTYVNISNSFIARGEYEKALEMVEKALLLKRDSLLAHRQKGYILFLKKDHQGSRDELLEALKINPYDYRSYNLLGCIMGDRKRWSEAEKYFRKSIRLNPGYIEAQRNLEMLHFIRDRNRDKPME